MIRFSRWVAVSILLAGGTMVAIHAAAVVPHVEVEPNGTFETATPFRFISRAGVGGGAITSADVDFWSFTAPAGARVWISADTGGTQVAGATSRDTVIDLLAADGITVIENDDDDGTGNGGDGSIETGLASGIAGRTLTAGGTYYVRVQAFSPTAIINPYRLLVTMTTGETAAEVEPNQTELDPNLFDAPVGLRSANISPAADVDFFSVFADVGDTILFSADADPERDGTGTDLVLELRAPDTAELLLSVDSSITGSLPNPAAEVGNFTVLTAGVYFVKVRHFSVTGEGSYDLMVARIRPVQVINDFDGDGKTDIGVYRESTGDWLILRSSDGTLFETQWGCATCLDISVPADYDLDGRADIGVYRNTSGEWFGLGSTAGSITIEWGAPSLGDLPMPADYDGDGAADVAVYRGTDGSWFVYKSSDGTVISDNWGFPPGEDIPVPADYDGDGTADFAVYRDTTGEWVVRDVNGDAVITGWGAPSLGDIPAQGDYDGDRKADLAVYRNTTGEWFILNSSDATATIVGWGAPSLGDIPVPGDYDGDGRTDLAVFRNSTGEWFILNSGDQTLTTVGWGAPSLGDIPLTRPSALR
jgi:hypothetical protein